MLNLSVSLKIFFASIVAFIFVFISIVAPIPAFATSHDPNTIPIGIDTSKLQGVDAKQPVGTVLSNALTIVFIIAALAVLFMLIFGAFQWIVSGGDKEAVAKARGRIVAALVGLAVLALAVLIVRVVGQLVGINVLDSSAIIPTLNYKPPSP